MATRIDRLAIQDADTVFEWVTRLLRELGEEGDELGELARDKVLRDWKNRENSYHVLVARDDMNEILGVLTLSVAFAMYANGEYGVIDEMYVSPAYRSAGIGAQLVNAAREFGIQKGWKRIDVTAPESDRWARTRQFYEKQGFVFTGPKLKLLL